MRLFHLSLLSLCLLSFCSCKKNSEKICEQKATITDYNAFGAIVLSVSPQDMVNAGLSPGDVLTLCIEDTVMDIPYFSGFFTKNGEYLVVAYPNAEYITITANNVGMKERFPNMKGKSITLALKEKGTFKDVEETLGMQYSNHREDYDSETEFANARKVTTSGMADGRLFRTASPFDNKFSRAPYVSAFLQENGVQTALNLTDDAEKLNSYTDIHAYSQQMIKAGNVVLCKVDANYRSEAFNKTLVAGLTELLSHPAPYVVHCTEGKDRTGYVCALLEGLAGATYDEIAADYLYTYYNYFHLTSQSNPKACQLLLNLRLDDALLFFCNITDVEQLKTINLAEAMQQHLVRYGMSEDEVNQLSSLLKDKEYHPSQLMTNK